MDDFPDSVVLTILCFLGACIVSTVFVCGYLLFLLGSFLWHLI